MMVEMAFHLRRDARRISQISSGRVCRAPIKKELTAISSIESVKMRRAAPMDGQLKFRQRDTPERLPVVGAQVERRFPLPSVRFCRPGEDLRGRNRISAVRARGRW